MKKFFERLAAYTLGEYRRHNRLPPLALTYAPGYSDSDGDAQERTSALWAAVHLIASSIAAAPKYVAKVDPANPHDQGEYAAGHYLNQPGAVLKMPSRFLSRYTFYEQMVARILTTGNSFVHIGRDTSGTPRVLTLAERDSVCRLDNGMVEYRLRFYGEDGQEQKHIVEMGNRNVIRLHGDGYRPENALSPSPIQHALAQTMGIALDSQAYQRKIFADGVLTRGFITAPGEIKRSADARKQFEEYLENVSGSGRATSFLELPPGYDYRSVAFPAVDQQVIELMRWSAADVARCYRIPPALLGVKGDSTAGAGAENVGSYFVNYTLKPLVETIECEFTRALLTAPQVQRGYVVRIDVSRIAAGTETQRVTICEKLVAGGLVTANEARAKLGLPPIEGGDELSKPVGGTPAANNPSVPMNPVADPPE